MPAQRDKGSRTEVRPALPDDAGLVRDTLLASWGW